jgi:hypothetical protein
VGKLGERADVVGIGQPHDEAVADGRTGFGGGHKGCSVFGFSYAAKLAG